MGARSTSSRAALGGRGVGADSSRYGWLRGRAISDVAEGSVRSLGFKTQTLRSSGRSYKDRPEVSTRKFPLGGLPVGSFHSGVFRSVPQGSVGLHRQPPSRAACGRWCAPFSPVPLGCFRRKSVHRTLAYRRGAKRAGGSVLRERCVRRGRRRPAPRHAKGAHAAARVRRSLCSRRPRPRS